MKGDAGAPVKLPASVRIQMGRKECSMNKQDFWKEFHAAWGMDRGQAERRPDYNKEAWMHVQAKIELYFLNTTGQQKDNPM